MSQEHLQAELQDLLRKVEKLESLYTRVSVKTAGSAKGPASAFDLYMESVKEQVKKENPGLTAPAILSMIKKRYSMLSIKDRQHWAAREMEMLNSHIKQESQAPVQNLTEYVPKQVIEEVKKQVEEKKAMPEPTPQESSTSSSGVRRRRN